jgi:hypothetical protein
MTTIATITNPVTALVETIQNAAAARGLTLQRYQTTRSKFQVTINYALHSGPVRPSSSLRCDGERVTLNQREGTTTRCEAYRALSGLLAGIT